MRRRFSGPKSRLVLCTGLILIGGAAFSAWLYRDQLLTWYYVQRLLHADDDHREAWIERLLALEHDGVGRLIGCLSRDDARACANGCAALRKVAERADDERRLQRAARRADAFPRCSHAGQASVLDVEAALIQQGAQESGQVTVAALSVLPLAQLSTDRDVHTAALGLARELLRRARQPATVSACREL